MMERQHSSSCCSSDAEDGGQQPHALLRTTAAFFRWRQARLKASFKAQLQGLLSAVAAEE